MSVIDRLRRSKRLIILDDYFPNLLSGFRIAEYNYYLKEFPQTRIYSLSQEFDQHFQEYQDIYPGYKNNIEKYDPDAKLKGSLFYTVFINNIFNYLPVIEKEEIPFVFTLYPAGGFWLNEPESDNKIQSVCKSRYFKKVIVTQKISRDYLIEHQFCEPDQIEFIYGGVFPSEYYKQANKKKRKYKSDKETFDICFVAHKYMEGGKDKGYDTFTAVAKQLVKIVPDIRFHVVGNFDRDEIDVTEIGEKITFYGMQHLSFFAEFYARMDIILSPNIPFVLYPGNFDGFPTGCCIEAGLSGVAVFCTDELELNVAFSDRQDIVLIPGAEDGITDLVREYYLDPDSLYKLSEHGKRTFNEVFSLEHQMQKRVKIFNQFL